METQLKQKWISGWHGLYSIREDGAVRSHDRLVECGEHKRFIKGRWLKSSIVNGYPSVILTKKGIRVCASVHRLVAEAFIPNPNGLPEVNHIDEVKSNNNISNLEWMTSKDNSAYSNAREYLFVSPSGSVVTVYNLTEFCKENNLSRVCMGFVNSGSQFKHKGWTRFSKEK